MENNEEEADGLCVKPFDFIRKVHPKILSTVLEGEHPQTIALVLSYLEPNVSANIMNTLTVEVATEVSWRIATIENVDQSTLREVERVIEKKIASNADDLDLLKIGGVETIVEILNLSQKNIKSQIIESLEDMDPELAEEVKARLIVFEDVVSLSDSDLQKVLREITPEEMSSACMGADSEVQNKIFKNLSRRAAAMMREDMYYNSPMRSSVVEAARKKIVSIMRHLDDTDEISLFIGDEMIEMSEEAIAAAEAEVPRTSRLGDSLTYDEVAEKVRSGELARADLIGAVAVLRPEKQNEVLSSFGFFEKLRIKYLAGKFRLNLDDPEAAVEYVSRVRAAAGRNEDE